MNSTFKKLYIVTGKGGVGKTTLSLSLAHQLKRSGANVSYHAFGAKADSILCEKLGINTFDLDLIDSAETYIAKKLKSETIANWIMKTSFFRSLFMMVPGLGNMIYLGHIIDELEKNDDLVIVIDSPASGHALTMFEASANFKKIFNAGLIVKDIDRMHNFLQNKNNLKTIIISLPTELAQGEAIDLQEQLKSNLNELDLESEIITNDSYLKFMQSNSIDHNELPDFMKRKLLQEQQTIRTNIVYPHVASNDEKEIITTLSPLTQEISK